MEFQTQAKNFDKTPKNKSNSSFKKKTEGRSSPTAACPRTLKKNLSEWSPEDVKWWLQEEGFPEFWSFLEPHNPTGVDLLMLSTDDWHSLIREAGGKVTNGHRCPSVVQVNRLFYKVNKLKLAFGLPQKLPKLSFCLTGNPVSLVGPKSVFISKQNSSGESHTDEELEQNLSPNSLNRKSSLIHDDEFNPDNPLQQIHSNGSAYKFDHDKEYDSEAEDVEEDDQLSFSGLDMGPCPFCNNQIKREKAPILPERWKALLAFFYALGVSWVTAFVMVIVHDRVPDMDRYPPLPDILLDNIPHIPWAFEMCEFTGMILISLWGLVLLFHKHRFVLMRRFFSISGTIFLLRCVTMLITSLSVPGKHLDCSPRPYGDIWNKLYNAYVIWTGAGMTLQGVRTCGDYMFSGHTVALTLLNFFITEYTSRKIYFLHTLTWICNVFGIFFILAAHEHYSIDVFVAFYITSRLFMYYHTLANQPVVHNFRKKSTPTLGHFSYDAHRVWLWFPMFSFFESRIDGKIPNEFEWPINVTEVCSTFDKVVSVAKGFSEKIGRLTASNTKENGDNQNWKRHDKNGIGKQKKLKKK